MDITERLSKNLGIKYVYVPERKVIVCEDGVAFDINEYKNGVDIVEEHQRRLDEGILFDYAYARSTGRLRKKRRDRNEKYQQVIENSMAVVQNAERREEACKVAEPSGQEMGAVLETVKGTGNTFTVNAICFLLSVTAVISMYMSTLHTATYLFDYVDMFSAWLMSASITSYNATAFEVSILFNGRKRRFLAVVFLVLWVLVTAFSMTTTVSVFYDRFNFTEAQVAEENSSSEANRKALELLQKKEADIREAIEFKKKDIEYRQEHDYATTAVRKELTELQSELHENLDEQQKVLMETPDVAEEGAPRKERLFSFLGRLLGIESGIIEFVMSTLSAVFINLVSPTAVIAITEITRRKRQD